jgi:hypothetical protein
MILLMVGGVGSIIGKVAALWTCAFFGLGYGGFAGYSAGGGFDGELPIDFV